MPPCACCCGESKARCSRCGAAYYCGRKCQLEHWPLHKGACSSTAHMVTARNAAAHQAFEARSLAGALALREGEIATAARATPGGTDDDHYHMPLDEDAIRLLSKEAIALLITKTLPQLDDEATRGEAMYALLLVLNDMQSWKRLTQLGNQFVITEARRCATSGGMRSVLAAMRYPAADERLLWTATRLAEVLLHMDHDNCALFEGGGGIEALLPLLATAATTRDTELMENLEHVLLALLASGKPRFVDALAACVDLYRGRLVPGPVCVGPGPVKFLEAACDTSAGLGSLLEFGALDVFVSLLLPTTDEDLLAFICHLIAQIARRSPNDAQRLPEGVIMTLCGLFAAHPEPVSECLEAVLAGGGGARVPPGFLESLLSLPESCDFGYVVIVLAALAKSGADLEPAHGRLLQGLLSKDTGVKVNAAKTLFYMYRRHGQPVPADVLAAVAQSKSFGGGELLTEVPAIIARMRAASDRGEIETAGSLARTLLHVNHWVSTREILLVMDEIKAAMDAAGAAWGGGWGI